MDDSHRNPWCGVENMAPVVGNGRSTNLHLSVSHLELVHRHARRLLLRSGYAAMGEGTGRPRTRALLSNGSTSFPQERPQIVVERLFFAVCCSCTCVEQCFTAESLIILFSHLRQICIFVRRTTRRRQVFFFFS